MEDDATSLPRVPAQSPQEQAQGKGEKEEEEKEGEAEGEGEKEEEGERQGEVEGEGEEGEQAGLVVDLLSDSDMDIEEEEAAGVAMRREGRPWGGQATPRACTPPAAPLGSPAAECGSDDMSCSSGRSACMTMSTRKAARHVRVLESDEESLESDSHASREDPEGCLEGGFGVATGDALALADECGGAGGVSPDAWPRADPSPSPSPSLGRTPGKETARSFSRKREDHARALYAEFNAAVFGGRLPSDLAIKWNANLQTTAGITQYGRRAGGDGGGGSGFVYYAHIELSTKVIDRMARLKQTLCHEMCHVATWMLNHVAKPPHGAVFKSWADRAMACYPELNIHTCHSYDIHYKFRWKCGNDWCGHTYGRHSNSIDVHKQACGICSGKLNFLGKFGLDGTPAKARAPTQFSLFVKTHFADAKRTCGKDATHGDVMKHLSRMWNEQKEAKQKDAARGDSGAPGEKAGEEPARAEDDDKAVKSLIARFESFGP